MVMTIVINCFFMLKLCYNFLRIYMFSDEIVFQSDVIYIYGLTIFNMYCLHKDIFRHYLINDTIFGKSCGVQNVCFHFLYNFCLKHFSL